MTHSGTPTRLYKTIKVKAVRTDYPSRDAFISSDCLAIWGNLAICYNPLQSVTIFGPNLTRI